ncbi:MAG: PQQ-dependent sugar dehydrogenase [Pseudomonadota bacterium]
MRIALSLTTALAAALALSQPAAALQSSAGSLNVQAMVTGLDEPWGIAFLPGGGYLITERSGRLLHFGADGSQRSVGGVPDVRDDGQGGLLDVMVPRDFAESREVFLSFAMPQGRGEGTALAVGRLSADSGQLESVRVIFEMERGTNGGQHFGSRIVEAPDGTLFLTIGDRGDWNTSQNLGIEAGSIVRVNRDGSVPSDNPFVGTSGAQAEIWSYGHRNPQGAALDADGTLWINEHGARGGDEVNRIARGANYGWPVISYGVNYNGTKIGEGTAKEGMEQPAFYWDPSIAPSGMAIYSGRLWPEWEGDFFVGSLKFGLISRLERNGNSVQEVERIEGDETARVRDIVEAPDGALWILSVGQGAAYRITPG